MAQMVLYLVLLALLSLLALLRRAGARRNGGIHRRQPPSPPSLPIIGHLHLLGSNPHLSLRDLATKHAGAGAGDGDDGFMLLRLGQAPNLVVSTPRAAEAVLRSHDHVFASRPPSAVADILLAYSDVALAPYGDYWRQVRRLVTTHVLSASKVLSLRRARQEEVALVVAGIRAAAAHAVAVDMTEVFCVFANDMVCRAVSGKFFRRLEGRHAEFQEVINSQVVLIAGFNLDDCFPWLAKLGGGGGALARKVVFADAFRLKRKWDVLLDEIIDEHAAKLSSVVREEGGDKQAGGQSQEDDDADFVHVLLSLQHEYRLTRQQVKAILVDMFGAGTDTSSILLEYALIELIRNPDIMAKLQDEITKNTPKGQEMVKEEDLANMSYLRAIIKETLRLYPPTPLLLPHFCMEDCEVGGYAVSAGTRVIVNAWALGRDAGAWDRPEEFVPERFLPVDSSGDDGGAAVADFRGRDFKFVPFGAGRRMCPGINFGMAVVELMLANLVYCFRWELPAGMAPQDVDMSAKYGLTSRRKEKLLLVPFPRQAPV